MTRKQKLQRGRNFSKGTEDRQSSTHSRTSVSQHLASSYSLTQVEKFFLLYAERGDCASVQKIINEYKNQPLDFNINCLDPLNRTALIIGIEKENIDLINLLLEAGIQVKDALLHAINEEYVEGVEVLLQWEERNHVKGEPYSWECVDKSTSGFTLDITPVILAAHKNNYEILKLLLDRGATLPKTHDVRCGCNLCIVSKEQDSLRHSQARINTYKALSSPSLICLSSSDPLLTAIELYGELKRLELAEAEFRSEYNVMRRTVQTFATSLLDHVRTSNELETMLNYSKEGVPWVPGETQTLDRLKLAIKYKLKMFVAHPNVQQLLASIWYEGLPGFRRKNVLLQTVEVIKISFMFVIYSLAYMFNPYSHTGSFLKMPFVKFVCHSASYGFFLGLLALASQKVENLCYQLLGFEKAAEWAIKERGSMPGFIETLIIIYIISLVWKEIRALYVDGPVEYSEDLWNILDFISNIFYITWISLRFMAIYIVRREYERGYDPWYPRDRWDIFDPHSVSECAFASGMILSFMKLINIFSLNPHLGPLRISLGRMIIDIIKFFFIYTLVLFAFGCGLNQLLWYFSGLEEVKCYHGAEIPDFEDADKACTIWRRFANIFETSQSLFWASFGLVDLTAFDLTGIKGFTRFWALLIFGCYSAINIIVLLNMLIAMMSNSYQIISERADTEWKFARSKLFISFFEEGDSVPPPFNLFPTMECFSSLFIIRNKKKSPAVLIREQKSREKADVTYDIVMQFLIRRYITAEQKKLEEFSVTEDDIAEVRHDISKFRFELLELFRKNNYEVPDSGKQFGAQGKKERIMERRIIKDFQIGMVEGVVNEIISNEKTTKDIFGKIAKAIGRSETKKKDWNAVVRRSTIMRDPIGSTSEARRKQSQLSIRRYILDHAHGSSLLQMDSEKLVEYNPNLVSISPIARIAYAGFKMNLIRMEYDVLRGASVDSEILNRSNMAGSMVSVNVSPTQAHKNMKLYRAASKRLRRQSSSRDTVIIINSPVKEESKKSSSDSNDTEEGAAATSKQTLRLESPIPESISTTSSPSKSTVEEKTRRTTADSLILSVQPKKTVTPTTTPFKKGTARDGNWL